MIRSVVAKVMTSLFDMNGMTISMSSLVAGSKINFTSFFTTSAAPFANLCVTAFYSEFDKRVDLPSQPRKIMKIIGGEGGIRTHGTVTRTTVFETVPFDHSGT